MLAASQEARSYHVFLGEVRVGKDGPGLLRWIECPPQARDSYLFGGSTDAYFAVRSGSSFDLVRVDRNGSPLRTGSSTTVENVASLVDFESLATVAFEFGREWSGRLFIFDPSLSRDLEE